MIDTLWHYLRRRALRPTRRTWRRWFGDRGEREASRFLRRRGIRVLTRQYRTARGEIDLVCRDRDVLVFVEVKHAGPTPSPETLGFLGVFRSLVSTHPEHGRCVFAPEWCQWCQGRGSAEVVAAWPALPAEVRAQVLAPVRRGRGGAARG